MAENVLVIDHGFNAILRELQKVDKLDVAIGVQENANANGQTIAEYAAYNEFGTNKIPSRPFMRIAFDRNRSEIDADFDRVGGQILTGQYSAQQALTVLGIKQTDRIKNTISGQNIPPPLSAYTVAQKGDSKTLVDTGAMINSITFVLKQRGTVS